MSSEGQNLAIRDGLLVATFHSGDNQGGTRRVRFEAVVDESGLGEVVGVEILDMRAQLDGALPPTDGGAHRSWSYDDETDAFYLRVAEESAPFQRLVQGIAVIGVNGQLLALEVPVG